MVRVERSDSSKAPMMRAPHSQCDKLKNRGRCAEVLRVMLDAKHRKLYDEVARYAKRRTLINYEPLARLFGLDLQSVVDRNHLSAMLGTISTYEYRKHGFMISAIVVKMDNGRLGTDPGPGFWTCAADLGIFDPDADDPLAFHMEQVAKVHAHYARKKPRPRSP